MAQYRSIIRIKIFTILALFLTITSVAEAASRSFIRNNALVIDNNGFVVSPNRVGIGLAILGFPLTVNGSVRFRGAVGTVPVTNNISTIIDWKTAPHKFLTINNAAVTQSITFIPPAGVGSVTLLLVVSRNIGISFPNTVKWVGGASMTFPTPVASSQLDVFSFIADGNGGYIGYANLDFKASASRVAGGQ